MDPASARDTAAADDAERREDRDACGTERAEGPGESSHRDVAEQHAEHRIPNARGDRHAQRVVDEGEDQILLHV